MFCRRPGRAISFVHRYGGGRGGRSVGLGRQGAGPLEGLDQELCGLVSRLAVLALCQAEERVGCLPCERDVESTTGWYSDISLPFGIW